jgi:hypothetical protein
MKTTISGWLGMAVTTILLASCGSNPGPKPAAAPATERTEVLSAWIKVYETVIEESDVKRTATGFVEHRRLEGENEGSYFVYSIKNMKTPVGFFLPSGETYRYVTEVNSKKVVSKSLGPLEPEAAVKILLRIKANVEFDKKLEL